MSATAPAEERDEFLARLARHASGLLRQFNDAGVLAAADVHVARRLGVSLVRRLAIERQLHLGAIKPSLGLRRFDGLHHRPPKRVDHRAAHDVRPRPRS